MENIRINNWSAGSNNMAAEARLPEASARAISNLDPIKGGTLDLCPQFERVCEAEDLRAAFGLGSLIVFVDGGLIKTFSANAGARVIGEIGAGVVAGAELNGKLYFCVPGQRFVFDGLVLREWATMPPVYQIASVAGSMPAGVYKVAVTVLDGEGYESGALVSIINLPTGSAIRVSSADARTLRLYVSPCDAATLYDQGTFVGERTISNVVSDSLDLQSANMVPLPDVSMLAAVSGMLFGARDRYVFRTEPMRPHVHDRVRGFYQFPDVITLLAPIEQGLFVCTATGTWFITSPGTGNETMAKVLDFGAVRGTYVRMPDGRATWFSDYGQVVGAAGGQVELLNYGKFSPDIASAGAAGLLSHNGLQSAVTSMRGSVRASGVAVRDSWNLEVL